MSEIFYHSVEGSHKYCSVRTPETDRKGLCGSFAHYAVLIGSGWYWRCSQHKDVVSFNADSTYTRGDYSRYYPSILPALT